MINWVRRLWFRLQEWLLIRRLHRELTPGMVREIVAAVGGHVADRKARYQPETDLPFPKTMVEVAFFKAIRDWPDGEEREALLALYLVIDDCMLSAAECEVLNRYHYALIRGGEMARAARLGPEESRIERMRAVRNVVNDARGERAERLMDQHLAKMHRRKALIDKIRRHH